MGGTTTPAVRWVAMACALLGLIAPVPAAELAVAPTRLHFEPGSERAMVQLHNAGREAVTVQAEILQWERDDGVDRHTASDAILVSPPVFRIEAGATQYIRLGLRRPPDEQRESAYRLQLRELPVASDAGDPATGMRVLLALRVPVHVAPRRIHREARWQPLERAEQGLWLQNAGNVHLRVQGVRALQGADASPAELKAGVLLFPGEARAVALPEGRSFPQGVPLELLTDRGPVRAAPLDVAR